MHVRTIGKDAIGSGDVFGVAATPDLIAVGLEGAWIRHRVILFDMHSGTVLRSFGVQGLARGALYGTRGLRFTPDGTHVLVAEAQAGRLSLFTLSGEFVRCVGEGAVQWPTDVEFAPNGDILVANINTHRVCVLAPDGAALLRSFHSDVEGVDADGLPCGEARALKSPIALAMRGNTMYVLHNKSGRIQLFR